MHYRNSFSNLIFFLLLIIILNSHCGFHLRGSTTNKNSANPSDVFFTSLHVSGKPETLPWPHIFKRALIHRGVTVTKDASWHLVIVNTHTHEFPISYNSKGEATEYMIKANLYMQLQDQHGNIKIPTFHLNHSQSFFYDKYNHNAELEERRLVQQEIKHTLVWQALTLLQQWYLKSQSNSEYTIQK